jgi:hypothetical protein
MVHGNIERKESLHKRKKRPMNLAFPSIFERKETCGLKLEKFCHLFAVIVLIKLKAQQIKKKRKYYCFLSELYAARCLGPSIVENVIGIYSHRTVETI